MSKYKPRYTLEDLQKISEKAMESNNDSLSNYFKVRKLNEYSSKNTSLINGQTNGIATIVKSYKQWNDLGIQVLKGESALKIYVPTKLSAVFNKENCFITWKNKVTTEEKEKIISGEYHVDEKTKFILNGNVFDIKQTTAKETDFIDGIKPNDNLHSILLDIANKYEINVEYSNTMPSTNYASTLGFATIRDKKLINLDINLSVDKINCVFLHEIAHLELGHLRSKLPLEQKEFEAEAVSYLVALHYGIEDNAASNQYLKHYYNEELFNLEDISSHILDLSNKLIEKIDSYELNTKEKEIVPTNKHVVELDYMKGAKTCFTLLALTNDINNYKVDNDYDYEIVINNSFPIVAELEANGEYYAHEYDEWVQGISTNYIYEEEGTFKQVHLVKCLDESKIVMDGLWEQISDNGCGDRFEACEQSRLQYTNHPISLIQGTTFTNEIKVYTNTKITESNYKDYLKHVSKAKKTGDLKYTYLNEHIGNLKINTIPLENLSIKSIKLLVESKLGINNSKSSIKQIER